MRSPKLWSIVASVGFGAVACSIAMAFLSDHHWLVPDAVADLFDNIFWWVQLAGVVLSATGCVGMSKTLSETLRVRIGLALIAATLLLIILAGGPSGILTIHDWTIALFLPVLVTTLGGILLTVAGLSW